MPITSLTIKKTIPEMLKLFGIDNYAKEYKERLKGVPSALVSLCAGNTSHQEQVLTLCERVRSRAENKPMEVEWFNKLVTKYSSPPKEFTSIFNHVINATSSDYERVHKALCS